VLRTARTLSEELGYTGGFSNLPETPEAAGAGGETPSR
jgi:hypothetical protein